MLNRIYPVEDACRVQIRPISYLMNWLGLTVIIWSVGWGVTRPPRMGVSGCTVARARVGEFVVTVEGSTEASPPDTSSGSVRQTVGSR